MKIARVLHLTENESKDRAGREIGDDWLIASFGCDSAGNDVHVTTEGGDTYFHRGQLDRRSDGARCVPSAAVAHR